jgi:hypothetical protein
MTTDTKTNDSTPGSGCEWRGLQGNLKDYTQLLRLAKLLYNGQMIRASCARTSADYDTFTKVEKTLESFQQLLASMTASKPLHVNERLEAFGTAIHSDVREVPQWKNLFDESFKKSLLRRTVADFCREAGENLKRLSTNLVRASEKQDREEKEACFRELEPETLEATRGIRLWSESLDGPPFQFTKPHDLLTSIREVVEFYQKSVFGPRSLEQNLSALVERITQVENGEKLSETQINTNSTSSAGLRR